MQVLENNDALQADLKAHILKYRGLYPIVWTALNTPTAESPTQPLPKASAKGTPSQAAEAAEDEDEEAEGPKKKKPLAIQYEKHDNPGELALKLFPVLSAALLASPADWKADVYILQHNKPYDWDRAKLLFIMQSVYPGKAITSCSV